MKNLSRFLLLLVCLIGASAFGQVTSSCQGGPCAPITTSGGTVVVPNLYGGMSASFEEIVSGAPASVSITVQGCLRGGTCDSAMDTNTLVGSIIRSVVPVTKPYGYFLVTATWTGGTNPTVTINPFITSAKVGAGGGGAFVNGLGTGFQDVAETVSPGNPSAGTDRLYFNSSTHVLTCLTSAGASCLPSGGTPAFSAITAGTNATALLIGTSGSLGPTGTGTITATNIQASAGFAPTADGVVGINTTTHALVNGSNGTTVVGAVAATGTGTATTCTSQVVTVISAIAVPTCTALTSAFLPLSAMGTISGGTWQATAIAATFGGTGIDSHLSTGVAQVSAGTWTVSTTLPSGLSATNLTLITPTLGTPASGTATNITGLPISTGVSGLGSGVATFLGTASSANLFSAMTTKTGSGGSLVFATGPTLSSPLITTILDGNGNPFLLSSATASAVDSITVTNAATANPATVSITASGTDNNINLNLVSKGTGTITCNGSSCGSGGTVWSAIGNPAGNLALTMGSNTSTFNTTTAVSQYFKWANTTAAVVGASQSSPIISLCGTEFHAAASAEGCLALQFVPGTGTDAANTVAITHTGTATGATTTTFPGPIQAGSSGGVGGGFTLPEGTALAGSTNNDTCYGDSTAHAVKCSFNNDTAQSLMRNSTTSTTTTQVPHATAVAGVYAVSAIVSADLPAITFDKSASGLANPTADATFTYPNTSTTGHTLAGTAPASVSTATGTNGSSVFNATGATGGADSNATGTAGIGGSPTITGGNGGAGTGTNAVGGAGGAVTFTGGNGGASLGTGINANGGNVVVLPGAAGTGGSGTAGKAGVMQVGSSAPFPIVGTSGGSMFGCGTAPTGIAANGTIYCNASNFPDLLSGTTDLGSAVAEASIIAVNVIPKAAGTNPQLTSSALSDTGTILSITDTTINGAANGPLTIQSGVDAATTGASAVLTIKAEDINGGSTTSLTAGAATLRGGNNASTGNTNTAGAATHSGGDVTGGTGTGDVAGAAVVRGGNCTSATGTCTPGAASVTGGGQTAAVTNGVGTDTTIAGGLGTGNAAVSHVKIQSPALSQTSGSTAQTQVTRFTTHVKAGSTTSATATNMFNVALANSQTAGFLITVHVETTQATPQNCSTTEIFVAAVQDTSGTVTSQTTAGSIGTICSTGTLTLAAAFSAAAPSVFSVTPSWATIVPTAVTITVQIQNLSQQEIALL